MTRHALPGNVAKRRACGAAALLLTLPALWFDRPMFFAAWLAAWWFGLGVVLGALANLWMHRLTGGRWGDALRPASVLLAARMPWLLLLFVPLLFGLDALYPWLHAAAPHEMAQPAFHRWWLDPRFFAARLVAYALVWWWLSRSAAGSSGARAAASLLAHGFVTSLAAIDLLMSLQPLWYSTVFALTVLAAQQLAGSALAVALTARCRALPPAHPPLTRDFGNLLLTWVLSWAYLAFMQLLIIRAENLPREIAWYLPRLQTGWREVGIALMLLQFALPLLALLMRGIKDDPRRLSLVAFALLAAGALHAAWLVLPSVAPQSLHGWWLLPLLTGGLALLLFGDLPERLRGVREAAPESRNHARAST